MKKLSTGQDSTLGTYKKLATIFGDNAVQFFNEKIKKAPNGEDEEVLTDESQMMHLMYSFKDKDETSNNSTPK